MPVIIDGHEYVTNAPKGAALLDREVSGWADRIDLDEFKFDDVYHCILGQLYGGYIDGRDELFSGEAETQREAVSHGFDWDWAIPSATLQLEWELLIKARKTA